MWEKKKYSRNLSFRNYFFLINVRMTIKEKKKYGRNIVKQVVEPVNTMRKGRALFELCEFCSTLRSIYRL
ncbi:MAG TPA: hypothetical protein PLR73_09960 [Acetivibrio sp.]|nr:hypothetical protein [Clostridium sp.]HOQ38018.1 hypothetical protein [Acetivibrio sp.]